MATALIINNHIYFLGTGETMKITILLMSILGFFQATSFADFSSAKDVLKKIYSTGGECFYCDEAFNEKFEFTKFDGYKTISMHESRAKQVEWEHVVPAAHFGRHFKEWTNGDAAKCPGYKGRKCARRNAQFREIEGDLNNLMPTIGQVNAVHGSLDYVEIPGEKTLFGSCDVEFTDSGFEPPNHLKGDIARIHWYMEAKYHLTLVNDQKRALFKLWEIQDPINRLECERVKSRGIDSGVFKDFCQEIGTLNLP